MEYQLLVAWPVVELLDSLPRRECRRLRECLVAIRRDPRGRSDYQEPDAVGRPVEIHICAGYAFKYWIDHADRHIKVLDLYFADRPRS